MQRTAAWMRDNLTTQGYCLSDVERRELAVGLRFSTGLCLTLVVVALAAQPHPPSTRVQSRDRLAARRRHAARRWRHDGRTDPRQDARRGLCGRDCREFLRALRGARHVGAPPARPTHHQLRSTSP